MSDQNVKIFRGSVHHRPYFRWFSKNPFKNPTLSEKKRYKSCHWGCTFSKGTLKGCIGTL